MNSDKIHNKIHNIYLLFLLLSFGTGCISTTVLAPSEHTSSYKKTTKATSPYTYRRGGKKEVYYIVKKGDTLFSIAKKFNINVKTLMERNNLSSPGMLKAGIKLIIPSQPIQKKYYTSTNKLLFLWPVQGKILTHFGERINNKKIKGIEIATQKGAIVKACERGKVTFSSYIKGYGKTVIIKHTDDISTVYTNLSEILVKEGTYVKRGQAIGKVGKDPQRNIYLLHFEIRKGYKTQNPLLYLH